MKIVVNCCYGGFGISEEALALLKEDFDEYDLDNRTDAALISIIEEKGSDFASDDFSDLRIVTIPDNATDWEIDEYDGMESVIYVLDGKIYHRC